MDKNGETIIYNTKLNLHQQDLSMTFFCPGFASYANDFLKASFSSMGFLPFFSKFCLYHDHHFLPIRFTSQLLQIQVLRGHGDTSCRVPSSSQQKKKSSFFWENMCRDSFPRIFAKRPNFPSKWHGLDLPCIFCCWSPPVSAS